MSKNLISFLLLGTFLDSSEMHFEAQSGEHNGGLRASISCCCG